METNTTNADSTGLLLLEVTSTTCLKLTLDQEQEKVLNDRINPDYLKKKPCFKASNRVLCHLTICAFPLALARVNN